MTNTLDLDQFYGGTENYYRHALNPKVIFTDGVKYVADKAGAYWLIDKIALFHLRQPFEVWKLTVLPRNRAYLTVEDGDGNRIYAENLTYTDFPDPTLTLWFTANTILLPSEY